MPRKKHELIPNAPYFISARCLNKEWFRIPLPDVWTVMTDYLFFIHHAYDAKIHGFVLMSNHFHLLVSAPDLAAAMNYFMREVSRRISYRSRRINQVFGGPYHKTLVNDDFAFRCAYKYLYRNPVEAKIAVSVEDYRFSTLRGAMGCEHTIVPIEEDSLLLDSPGQYLTWLNTPVKEEARQTLKKAFRRKVFELPKKRDGRRNDFFDLH